MRIAFPCRPAFVCLALLLTVSSRVHADDFVTERAAVFRAYGATSQPDLVRLYHDTRTAALQSRSPGLLYRCVAYAELAGLDGELERTLQDILSTPPPDPRFYAYCIETLRARGALASNVPSILRASAALAGDDKDSVLAMLSDAFSWSKPPDALLAAARKGVNEVRTASRAVVIAAAMASWGLSGEASSALMSRASGKLSLSEMLLVLNALDQTGARKGARQAASGWIASRYPSSSQANLTLQELLVERESLLEPVLQAAAAASAWDILLDRIVPAKARSGEAVIDASIALLSIGKLSERAELLRRFYETRRDPDSLALYGNALISAGDAYMTQTALTMSPLSGKGLDDEPLLDLFDAVAILRDPQVLLGSSSLWSVAPREPQESRTVSEYARLMGDISLSDRLFGAFIVASGLGRDTRFNWEGSRYLANYYLDTGRLDLGVETARRALTQLIDEQGGRKITRSSQPARFVALFSRFGNVELMLKSVRDRRKDFPSSTLLDLLELDATEALGQWPTAIEITTRLGKADRPPARDVALAQVKARAGEIEEAISLYERAIAADPNVPEYVRPALLDLYARVSRWQAAEKIITDPEAGRSDTWFALGAFYEHYGQDDFAARAYGRLDDLSVTTDPREFARVIRFMSVYDPSKAASMLGHRIAAETSLDSKYEYISECLPQEAGQCAQYLTIGAGLQNGPLASDRRVLGLFHKLLSIRAARMRDYRTALAAAGSACAQDPGDIQNMQQLLDLAATSNPAQAEGIARSIAAILPLPSSFLELASAEFVLKRTDSAVARLCDALSVPLSPADVHRVTCVLLGLSFPNDLAAKTAGSVSSAWSWVEIARLAEAALASGDRKTAAELAARAGTGGVYSGRALWLTDFNVRAGLQTDALAAIALGLAQNADHPAFTIAEVDFARSSGSSTTASEALARALRRNPRPQFAALFRMESARLAARARSEAGK